MHLNIELTKNRELLKQYYKLREKSFREKLGISAFDGTEDELDKNSDILVARIGDECIGGIRICGAHQSSKIPLENKPGFLAQQLPNLNLQQLRYCQWMRFTLCPKINTPKAYIQNQFILAIVLFSAVLGYRYGFCASSRVHHRFYKRILSKHGYDYRGCENIEVKKEGEFDELEHLLYLADLHTNVGELKAMPTINVNTSFCLNLKEQQPLHHSALTFSRSETT